MRNDRNIISEREREEENKRGYNKRGDKERNSEV